MMILIFESSYIAKTGRQNAYFLMRSNDRFVFYFFFFKIED